jgi:uncharacterized protein YbjQ (UPF0145 family)
MALPQVEFMTTTANFLDGYRIVRTFGVVRGITVRSRSVFGTIGAARTARDRASGGRGREISPGTASWRSRRAPPAHTSR